LKDAILILGASSGIGRAVAAQFAMRRRNLVLAGRDREDLDRIAADLRVRYGIEARVEIFDATDFASHAAFFQHCQADSDGTLGGVVMCHGFMAPQSQGQKEFPIARQTVEANYLSAISILELAAADFEQKRTGFICAVSSVAGDRGRQSNYIYGSAKAALTTYMQGLRNRLTPAGVPVLTVKPGFVDTAMTWGLPGLFLVASPEKVASDIVKAIEKHKAEIYTPWFWWAIMLVIKSVPERIFRKMKL